MEVKKKRNRERLKEIIGVLRRHNITKGITPEKLKNIIEDLGPTFVKIGQIMSMRQDILPIEYCNELTKLRVDVKPVSYEEIKGVIEEEYGARINEIFLEFDQSPLGSASIAQVHKARIKDGSLVVVKVQRRGIKEIMSRDIRLLRRLSSLVKYVGNISNIIDFKMVLDEIWAVTQQEMDFLMEARQTEEFQKLNCEVAYVDCPRIEHKYTTSKVLVMEYIEGEQIDDIDKLLKLGYNFNEIGEKLAENYIKQVIEDGFFHADPHPGNLRIREGKIVWIDFGMMGRLSQRDRQLFKDAVKAIVDNDIYTIKSVLLTLGAVKGKVNHVRLYADIDDMITKYGSMELGDINLAHIMEELMGLASEHSIIMPQGVTMLSRGMITMEGVISKLCPDINIIKIMANHTANKVLSDVDIQKEIIDTGRKLYYSSKKILDIPSQLSDILKMTIKGQTKVNLELMGSEEPLSKIDKMVNKVIVCIISAALLIGSSLICTTKMTPEILGIPALGAIGYLASIILCGWLLYSVLKRK